MMQEEKVQWKNRPFCRNDTQSDPEDTGSAFSSDSEVECFRDCQEYYEKAEERRRKKLNEHSEQNSNQSNYSNFRLSGGSGEVRLPPEIPIQSGEESNVSMVSFWDSDTDTDESITEDYINRKVNNTNTVVKISPWEELCEGFRLVFFIAIPMLARQLGSIISRRILSRLFGRH